MSCRHSGLRTSKCADGSQQVLFTARQGAVGEDEVDVADGQMSPPCSSAAPTRAPRQGAIDAAVVPNFVPPGPEPGRRGRVNTSGMTMSLSFARPILTARHPRQPAWPQDIIDVARFPPSCRGHPRRCGCGRRESVAPVVTAGWPQLLPTGGYRLWSRWRSGAVIRVVAGGCRQPAGAERAGLGRRWATPRDRLWQAYRRRLGYRPPTLRRPTLERSAPDRRRGFRYGLLGIVETTTGTRRLLR